MGSNLKKSIYLFLVHIAFFVLGTFIFISLFSTPVFIGFSVFFYRGIALLLIATLFSTLAFIYFKKITERGFFLNRDIVLSAVLVFCFNLVFFTHVPVTAERSISIFLLGYLNGRPTAVYGKNHLTEVFINKYIYENEALEKRFSEQIVSGNIQQVASGYSISKRGMLLMNFYNIIAKIFKIDTKLIKPE